MEKIYSAGARAVTASGFWMRLVMALCLLAGALPLTAQAQTYTMPANGSNAFTTCSGTLYDDGGAAGPYSANANSVTTLTPATAGNKISLQFTSFSVEAGYDKLMIYDGSDTSAPLIGTYDYQSPGTVYATNSAGTLTLRLTSDGIVNYSGFSADISCVTSVPQADLAIQNAQVQPLSAVAGSSLTVSCYIYNLSGTTANSSNVGYYLSSNATLDASDVLLGNTPGSALSVGNSSNRYGNVTLPATTPSGSYYVLFVADYQNQVNESNETNNVSAVSLNVVPPTVDLVIQQPYVSPTSTAPGNALTLSCNIYNQGNATANYSSVGFYLSSDATLDANDQLLSSAYGSQLTPFYPSYRTATVNVPPGTAPGTYYILFAADYQNLVAESNEQNNVSAVSLTVAAPNVDLIVSQAQLGAYSGSPGVVVYCSAYVYNQGNTTAASSNVNYYLSTDATFSANDVLLNSSPGAALGAGQTNTLYSTLTIPTTTTAGNYYVLFVVDPLNAVPESNETNNVKAVSFAVLAPTVDLVIQSAYISPSTTVAGGSISASSYIYNQGNSPAASSNMAYFLSTDNAFSANDVLLATSPGGALGGGASNSRYNTFAIPTSTASGNYYILFVADYQNQVAETNEINNVSSAYLTVVAPGVDLTLSQPYLSRTTAPAGTQMSASATISNLGTTASASSNVGFYLSTDNTFSANDVLLTSAMGGTLYASGYDYRTGTFTIPATTAAGSYYVLFVADYLNQVSETNENNNVTGLPISITAPFAGTLVPFAGTASITSCNTTIADNGGNDNYANYSYGTLVVNPGTVGSKVRLTFSMFSIESCCDALSIYDGPSTSSPLIGTYTYSSPGVVTASAQNTSGTLTVLFASDGIVTYPGFEATVSCVTPGPPDLIVQQPAASLTTVAAGSAITLGATIRNQGVGDAAASSIGYYLSTNLTLDGGDLLLGTNNGGSLASGQQASPSGSFIIPASVAAGSYYLIFMADPLNAVAESNETNNVAATTLPLTVTTPAPDLVLTLPTLSPATVPAGNNVSVTCLLSNQGTITAPQSMVGFYLSTDNVLSANDLLLGSSAAPLLSVGNGLTRSMVLPIAASTPPGSYYILYMADYQGVVTESNEQNNLISLPVTVTIGTASREQLSGFTLSVFPNPATGTSFQVELTGAGQSQLANMVLYNGVGQQVAQQQLALAGQTRSTATFSTRELPKGVYVLHITGEHLNVTRRIAID